MLKTDTNAKVTKTRRLNLYPNTVCLGSRFEAQRVGCPLEHEKDFLLVAKRTKIVRMDLRQGPNEKPVEVFPLGKDVIKNAIAVEYDMEDDCLFYGDIVLDKIFMYCNTNGSTQVNKFPNMIQIYFTFLIFKMNWSGS